jgi:predicted phosphodiesterase
VRIGLLADLHWSVAPDASASFHAPYDFDGLAARCAATIEALVAHGCELLVVAGDVTHDGDEASCAAALDGILSASPIPVAIVEGNHDVRLDPGLLARRAVVRDGWRHAAALADEQLVALRAIGVDRDGRSVRDHGPASVPAHCRSTVLVSHFPLAPHAERLAAAGLPFPGALADRGALLERLAEEPVPTVVVSGHLHVRDATAHGSVLQLCVPALVEAPYEAAVVEIDPFGESVRCIRIGDGTGEGVTAGRGAEPWLLAPVEEHWDHAAGSWTRREVGVPAHHVLAEA